MFRYAFALTHGWATESAQFRPHEYLENKSLFSRYLRAFHFGLATLSDRIDNPLPKLPEEAFFAFFVQILGVISQAYIIGKKKRNKQNKKN